MSLRAAYGLTAYAPNTTTHTDDWHTRTACTRPGIDPDVFFNTDDTDEARTICRRCPVQATCLREILTAEQGFGKNRRLGIIAGLDGEERAALDPNAQTMGPSPTSLCGTAAAYKRHTRHGETPCQPCRDADRLARANRSTGSKRPAEHAKAGAVAQ